MATVELDVVRVLLAVAQAGSFTKAATTLRLDKSKVSRDIARLERSLRTTLLLRTTRSVRLTPEGEALVARVGPMVAGLEAALTAVPDRAAIPGGLVTLTTTPDVARELVAPILVAFRARYPAVRVQLRLTNNVVDLPKEGVDLALRIGRPGGEQLVARKISDIVAGFFAAPSYAQRRGLPAQLAQLAEHERLWPEPPRSLRTGGARAASADVECDDFGFLAELCRAGGGVALLPTYLVARDVLQGRLLRVLPDVELLRAPLYLVSRPVRGLPPRVSALRTFLLEQLLGRA
jgi:DNA-binding transcriptional LysR family regulator